jgi:Cytochrome P450
MLLRSSRKLITIHSFLLVRHPRVTEKLRAEIDVEIEGKTEITRSNLKRMNYLQSVLKESKT